MDDVIPECAVCPSQVCRQGSRDGGPDFCPMWGEFPDHRALYDQDEMGRLALTAAIIEAEGYRRWTRVRELVELCRRMDYSSVGIGYCPDMSRPAGSLARHLGRHGISAVLPRPRACDPVGLARRFRRNKTQLNVIAGMCTGHDALFFRASGAPVTAVIARDTVLHHNPAAALYISKSYLNEALYQSHRRRELEAPPDFDPDRIFQEACRVSEEGRGRWTRLEEILELAARVGATRLGMVFCHGLREEAKLLARILEANGFETASVGCKAGAVPKESVGLRDAQKVRPGRREMICNSYAQAELLNRAGTHINILLGQCVGHDSVTVAFLKAPVISLVAKDRVLAHNTIAGLAG